MRALIGREACLHESTMYVNVVVMSRCFAFCALIRSSQASTEFEKVFELKNRQFYFN